MLSVGIRPVMAQEAPRVHTPRQAAAELSKARFRFSAELEKIKGLVGRWEGTTSRVANGSLTAVVTYEVTGAYNCSPFDSINRSVGWVLSPDSDIKADLEGHAHELTLRIGADGSLTHDWLNYYLGAPAAKRNIALTRVK